MDAFRDAMEGCKLQDLGFRGDKFTWERGTNRERLDRAWLIQNGENCSLVCGLFTSLGIEPITPLS